MGFDSANILPAEPWIRTLVDDRRAGDGQILAVYLCASAEALTYHRIFREYLLKRLYFQADYNDDNNHYDQNPHHGMRSARTENIFK